MSKLYINPTGGLANRMRAMAGGLAMARDFGFGAEVLWPVNKDLGASFDRLFLMPEMDIEIKNVAALPDLFLFDEPRKKNFFLSQICHKARFSRCFFDNGTENPIMGLGREDLQGFARILVRSGLAIYPFSREMYRELFRPLPHIEEIAENAVSGQSGLIGLHIRRTDNRMSIENSPDRMFFDIIDRTLAEDSSSRFYLASDDAGVKDEFLRRYGRGTILTMDRPVARNTADGMGDALAEMIVLSRCRIVYGSYWSSFSEAAALLGGTRLVALKADRRNGADA